MSVKCVDHVISDVPTLLAVISVLVTLDMNWIIISFAMVSVISCEAFGTVVPTLHSILCAYTCNLLQVIYAYCKFQTLSHGDNNA